MNSAMQTARFFSTKTQTIENDDRRDSNSPCSLRYQRNCLSLEIGNVSEEVVGSERNPNSKIETGKKSG